MKGYVVDKDNRAVIVSNLTKDIIVIKEFDKIEKVFAEGTLDKYECELVLIEVENENRELVTTPFARRFGYPEWLMDFNLEDYVV